MQYTDKSFRELKSELNQTASTLPKHKKSWILRIRSVKINSIICIPHPPFCSRRLHLENKYDE